jgi:ABC-type branched-subunit amino acid transport system permease subunit
MMLALLKETLVQTQYLAPSLLMAAAVEDEGAALTEQAAMVALVVAVALILELVERQPLGRAITAERHQAQYLQRRTMDALAAAVRGR